MGTNNSTNLKYEAIEIPLNKRMLIFQIITIVMGIAAFIVVYATNNVHGNLSLKKIIPLAIVLTYLPRIIASAVKLSKGQPGLIINDEEIIDNSKAVGSKISWSDVTEVGGLSKGRVKYILIFVSNPEDYISQAPNIFMKLNMKLSLRKYRTPLCINTSSLKSNKEKSLLEMLQEILSAKKAARKAS
jgi:hypothetical protein